jgi:hypothetical protein
MDEEWMYGVGCNGFLLWIGHLADDILDPMLADRSGQKDETMMCCFD